MIKADIKFCDGSVHRCVGRIVNGQSVSWVSEQDVYDHIESIGRNYPGMAVVRILVASDQPVSDVTD